MVHKQVNENQSLLDSWYYEDKEYFCFYGCKGLVKKTHDICSNNKFYKKQVDHMITFFLKVIYNSFETTVNL